MYRRRNGNCITFEKRLIMDLTGKIAIVTGGTKGIGLETCKCLANEGAIVYACARNEVSFDNHNIIFHKLDVTDKHSCELLVNDIICERGKIDILVADAGITRDSLTVKMTDEAFDDVINTNLKGAFNLVRVIGPLMEKQGYGSIVAVSSVVGQYGNIGQANYAASKSGLIGMCKSWAKEFARKGANVRVNVVAPGYILTDMVKTVPQDLLDKFANQTMLKRLGQPQEVANAIEFLCSDKASYITGTVIDINGGMRL
jgi:3-oxoacyl-[acyl-carrier protein] reductase